MKEVKEVKEIKEVEKIEAKKIEMPVQTSEINLKLSKKKYDKVDILEGTKILFSMFDSKRILRFDLENKVFKLIEFADFGNFEYNYTAQGSIFLNILDGLLIVTGENHDLFYNYSHSKHTMNKIAKLTESHDLGSLVYIELTNTVACISGRSTKSVESYCNDDILSNYLKKKFKKIQNNNKTKNTWSKLPDLNNERTECPFIFVDNKYLYGFFGYDCSQKQYLDSIERINLESLVNWEIVEYKNEGNVSTLRKAHSLVKINENELLFIGGYDGSEDAAFENFAFFNLKKMEITQGDEKFPEISRNKFYNFQKNNNSSPFIDVNNKLHYSAIDEKNAVHIVEAKSLQYDLFIFFD